jgi:hypothetical protein
MQRSLEDRLLPHTTIKESFRNSYGLQLRTICAARCDIGKKEIVAAVVMHGMWKSREAYLRKGFSGDPKKGDSKGI